LSEASSDNSVPGEEAKLPQLRPGVSAIEAFPFKELKILSYLLVMDGIYILG
jgi:hypothetical protein